MMSAKLASDASFVELSAAPQYSARRQPALSGGSIVVQTTKHIRCVSPARGTNFQIAVAAESGGWMQN
jgi:hypothetical protein